MTGGQSTGVTAVDTVLLWCGAAIVVAGAAAVAWKWIRGFVRGWHRLEDFIDDWAGTPARPGVPAKPGMMERMASVEQAVSEVRHEVRPNGGSSMRDAISRVDRRTARFAPDDDP